ncbi:RNA 2',3'-cyclic phosphodiesterase [Halalkalibacter flavus]|uniref:RNA 2',3'-cyclic phosphodiesterase n=1 Tax=Halalkalibacter flavus TaxID=3090668 RepID=UPI002FCA319A
MQTHYFLAVPLPSTLKRKIVESISRKDFPFKRWVHEKDLHLTLVFLGSCTQEQLKQIEKKCQPLVTNWEAFTLELSTYGTFGSKKKPRIFWIGVKEEAKLYQLQRDVSRLCEESGFALDKKSFSPHITLARQWAIDNDYEAVDGSQMQGVHWCVDEFILYKSVLTETPKYKTVHRFQFGGGIIPND